MNNAAQIQHALIGMVTEIGELGDAFKKNFVYGKAIDNVNVMEECGDFLWYFTLLLDCEGVHMRDVDTLAEAYKLDPEFRETGDIDAVFALAYSAGGAGMAEPGELRKLLRGPSGDELVAGLLAIVIELLNRHGGYTLSECLAKNDNKLEIRTGKVFDPAAFSVRDLGAERAALEA
jgi:NTP pyrophosphatase (non-canonical NTP hydrolase)